MSSSNASPHPAHTPTDTLSHYDSALEALRGDMYPNLPEAVRQRLIQHLLRNREAVRAQASAAADAPERTEPTRLRIAPPPAPYPHCRR
ncbi:hypothetical protein [Salisaeta longa]|uniref:hypothetical protein n=1 Tax=Salisaeta longa TaxID=503170 RepID=UPI0012F7DCDB|nr:hypothetical protein [Salisaeta longa]